MDDHHEEHPLDHTIRELAQQSYGLPADTSRGIPRDEMWQAIQARRGLSSRAAETAAPVVVRQFVPRAQRGPWAVVAAMAATLAVGVAIGRAVTDRTPATTMATADSNARDARTTGSALPVMLAQLTNEHLARTEALLVSARQDLERDTPDAMLGAWARDLLSTTRLLLDTEQLTDPRLRQLLQDLELTLALIQQAQASGRAADVESVRDDLDSGDLLLRVRDAALPSVLSNEQIRGMSE